MLTLVQRSLRRQALKGNLTNKCSEGIVGLKTKLVNVQEDNEA